MSEGWVSVQSEMLEILNCFAKPGAVEKNKQGKGRQRNKGGTVFTYFSPDGWESETDLTRREGRVITFKR